MLSAEVIERLKKKIPTIEGNYRFYGITQLDIKCSDGSIKQFVLLFERLRVDEPPKFLDKNHIYADVLIKICDEVLIDIASKEISIDDAISKRLFRVYGDAEIWKRQLNALRIILPGENFAPRLKEAEAIQGKEEAEMYLDDWTDFSNLPQTDLSNIPEEFKALADHFASLRNKYSTKKVEDTSTKVEDTSKN